MWLRCVFCGTGRYPRTAVVWVCIKHCSAVLLVHLIFKGALRLYLISFIILSHTSFLFYPSPRCTCISFFSFSCYTYIYSLCVPLLWHWVLRRVAIWEMTSPSQWRSILNTFVIVSTLSDSPPCVFSGTQKFLATCVMGVTLMQPWLHGRKAERTGGL